MGDGVAVIVAVGLGLGVGLFAGGKVGVSVGLGKGVTDGVGLGLSVEAGVGAIEATILLPQAVSHPAPLIKAACKKARRLNPEIFPAPRWSESAIVSTSLIEVGDLP
jgi:hypothetical protein